MLQLPTTFHKDYLISNKHIFHEANETLENVSCLLWTATFWKNYRGKVETYNGRHPTTYIVFVFNGRDVGNKSTLSDDSGCVLF